MNSGREIPFYVFFMAYLPCKGCCSLQGVLLPARVIKTKDTRARAMTEFIELTVYESGDKVLLPVRLITGVVEDEDGTFIETGIDGKGKETGVFVTESYESVKEKLL